MMKYGFSCFLQNEMNLYVEKRKNEVTEATLTKDIICLSSFDNYINNNEICEINIESLSNWICSLSNKKNTTINGYISNMRTFLRYLSALHGKFYYMPEFKSAEDEYEPYYFTSDNKKEIYDIVDNWIPGRNNKLPWISIEFPMIIRILDGCGTRVNEVLALQTQDIDFQNHVILMRNTKNKKGRRVPIMADLSNVLSDYCRAMGIISKSQAYLFPRLNRNEHLKVYDIYKKFRNVLIRLGIRHPNDLSRSERGPCLYNLRHTFIIDSFRKLNGQGVSLDDTICYLSVYVGHFDLTETQRYLKFCTELFPEDIDRFYGLADEIAGKEDKWDRWEL